MQSRIAWRTRTSSNGAWSTRIVIGLNAPVGDETSLIALLLPSAAACEYGTWLITSTWPEISALTRAVSSGSSTISSWSTNGFGPQ